jgi:hypothetical protein
MSFVRAETNVRESMLSKDFTRTSRKKPTSARCASPSASLASVFVGGHVERRFGVTSVDANGRQSLGAQRMIEPYRERTCFEHQVLRIWRSHADKFGYGGGIRGALPAPDPLARATDRNCCLFH